MAELREWDVEYLINKYGLWGEHLRYPVEDWKSEVANDETRLGYWEAVSAMLEPETRFADGLTAYIVSLREEEGYTKFTTHFRCWAEDECHAEEQALNAYPDAVILSVYKGEED